MYTDKIKSWDQLKAISEEIQKNSQKTVFTNGCFDILHAGHVRYLAQARAKGDKLIIGLNSDISVKSIKGEGRPVNGEDARAEVLAALECVDYVTLFDEDTPLNLIKHLNPSVLVKGADWKGKPIAGADHVISMGGEVFLIEYLEGVSTTNIINKIRKENG